MNVIELTNNILPEPYNIQKQANHENVSYHGVVKCVLHFGDGKYKTISSDNTKDLLSVNIVRYNPKSEVEVNFVERVLMHYKDSVHRGSRPALRLQIHENIYPAFQADT